MKYLIVNADDYNLTGGVSRGIIDACSKGIVTSTTFMANLLNSEQNIPPLFSSKLAVGIHFNLTYGKPLCNNVPDLINEEGKFFRNLASLATPSMASQVFMELEMQYNRFLEYGLKPSHFDSHHHIHTVPALKDIFFEFAINKRLPVRALNGEHRTETRAKKIITTDCFYDSFYGENVNFTHLKNILTLLGDGVNELMCHPGYVDRELRNFTSYSDARHKELDLLMNPAIAVLIEDLGIKLINYSDLNNIYGK